MIDLRSRRHATIDPRVFGGLIAVLLATLAAGFTGGLIVWIVWRYDLLRLGDGPRNA